MAFSAAVFLVCLSVLFGFCCSRSSRTKGNSLVDSLNEKVPDVKEDVNWPGFPHLKQVSGLAVDKDGHLHIFHRGDRVWDERTFDRHYRLSNTKQGPIPNDTVLVVDTVHSKVLYSWGANKFYVPHGITVDQYGNTWVTDVGLHQVMMFPGPESNADLMIGEPFVPGAGLSHLCQPTDVAVMANGYFFVSDGYCNSRVLMFSKEGRLLEEIGAKDGIQVAHSLTLVPQHAAICVADREGGRILCYATGEGEALPGSPLVSIENHGLGRVFAIDSRGKDLFVINGPDLFGVSQSVSADHGLVIDIESGEPLTLWGPDKGFQQPHDLAVSPDGKNVYVAEIDLTAQKRVYKFKISG